MEFALIMAGCGLFGLVTGRWWALLGALPLGVVMGLLSDPWEVSKFYCGVVWAIAGFLAITLGVVLRKLLAAVTSARRRVSTG